MHKLYLINMHHTVFLVLGSYESMIAQAWLPKYHTAILNYPDHLS